MNGMKFNCLLNYAIKMEWVSFQALSAGISTGFGFGLRGQCYTTEI